MAIRILHVIDTMLGMGGMEKGVVNLIQHMDANRFEHVVCVIRSLGVLSEAIPQDRARVLCIGHTASGFRFLVPEFFHIIREFQPDIVHSRSQGAFEAILAGYWARSCSLVHSEHGMDASDSRTEPWRRRQVRRLVFGLADEVCAVSQHLRDYHALHTGFAAKIKVIHNGVDTHRFHSQETLRQGARRRLGLAPGEFCIGAVGRLEPVKGIATLLRSVAELPDAPARCRLLIAGDGGEAGALREMARSRPGLRSRVQFLGEINEIPEFLSALDVYVLPSLYEGISNSLLEAMAAGLPVVATATGGNPEVVVDGESGILVPIEDHVAIAGALQRLGEAESLRARLGREALQRIRTCFSMESMVKGYEALYSGIAGKSARKRAPLHLEAAPDPRVAAQHTGRE